MNKFHVGEEVIVFCPNFPSIHELNTKVLEILTTEECARLYPFLEITSPYCYNVGTTIDIAHGYILNHVGEGVLRKKHKPSTESYSELLKSIKEGLINA